MAFNRLTLLSLAALIYCVHACDVQQWAQCGGINYSGDTQCAPGLVCHQWNPYYFQCIPSPESPTSTSTTTPIKTTIRPTLGPGTTWDTVPASMLSTEMADMEPRPWSRDEKSRY